MEEKEKDMVETLFVLPSISGKGGTETVTSEVAKYYQSKKKEFIIVVMNGSDDNSWLESFPNIETPHHDNKIIRNLSYIYQLNKIIRKYQPNNIPAAYRPCRRDRKKSTTNHAPPTRTASPIKKQMIGQAFSTKLYFMLSRQSR